jgi:hypothetical protein
MHASFWRIVESPHLFGLANQPARQRSCRHSTLFIQFTELRHRLLHQPLTDPNASHKAPIGVNLHVLLANRVAQIHAPSEPTVMLQKIRKVVTTGSNRLRIPPNQLI